MTAVESHSTTHVSRTRIAQLGDELMSTLTFVTPDTYGTNSLSLVPTLVLLPIASASTNVY